MIDAGKPMTIDNDIMRMTQEDMVDEIMTLRGTLQIVVQMRKAQLDYARSDGRRQTHEKARLEAAVDMKLTKGG